MKNLLLFLGCAVCMLLVTVNTHGAENTPKDTRKNISIGIIAGSIKFTNAAYLATEDYRRQPQYQFNVSDESLECDKAINKKFDIIFVVPNVCEDTLEATVNKVGKSNAQLWASFSIPESKPLPNHFLNLFNFSVDLSSDARLNKPIRYQLGSREQEFTHDIKSLRVYESIRILLKAIEFSPNLSIDKLRDSVEKFRMVRVEAAFLRVELPPPNPNDVVLYKGDLVILQDDLSDQGNYLGVETFTSSQQGRKGWIQKLLLKQEF